MILVALGANLPTSRHGAPKQGLDAAVRALIDAGLEVPARSRWYRSAPVPPATFPWFVNGAIAVETELEPAPLLALLLDMEKRFGRRERSPGAGRPLDLDLLDYRGRVLRQARGSGEPALTLPHPRLHLRAFVLLPLRDIAPGWRHPVSGTTIDSLIAALPPDQIAEPLSPAPIRTTIPAP